MNTAAWAALVIATAVTALALLLRHYQASQVFKPERTDTLSPDPADEGLEFEDVFFISSGGHRLHGWWLPYDDAEFTLLMCHGNAGNIADRVPSAAFYQRLGLNVFVFDYRGYGRSPGRPTEQGLYDDAHAAWCYLTDTRGTAAEKIVLLGRSLGGAVASELALRVRPVAVIIESTFLSISAMARERYRLLPLWRLSWLRFDNLSRIGRIDVPLLLVHSVEDEVVPYSHGEALQALTGGKHPLLTIHGSHGGGYAASGDTYAAPVARFLRAAGVRLGSDD